jgi:hypothetical protein
LIITRLTSAALATVLLCGAVTAVAPASSAASKGCVTKAEFKKVKTKMTPAKVAAVVGTKGKRVTYAESDSYTYEIREYSVCSPYNLYSIVMISYSNNREDSKTAVWVHN